MKSTNSEPRYEMKSANYKFLMGRRLWALMALILIIAQTTRGEIIPQSRRTTWQAGVVGGIPTRTTIFANLTTANTLAEINAAIANCPSNQVVQLAAGTYALTDSVLIDRKNGVVLRGAGPDKTILSFGSGNGYANVRFIGTPFNDPNANEPPNVRDWTG